MRKALLGWLMCCCAWQAEAQCDGARYRYRVFDQIETQQGVVYGSNIGSSGSMEQLDMDIYLPAGDEVTDRPVVLVAH